MAHLSSPINRQLPTDPLLVKCENQSPYLFKIQSCGYSVNCSMWSQLTQTASMLVYHSFMAQPTSFIDFTWYPLSVSGFVNHNLEVQEGGVIFSLKGTHGQLVLGKILLNQRAVLLSKWTVDKQNGKILYSLIEITYCCRIAIKSFGFGS